MNPKDKKNDPTEETTINLPTFSNMYNVEAQMEPNRKSKAKQDRRNACLTVFNYKDCVI